MVVSASRVIVVLTTVAGVPGGDPLRQSRR
jgi:hypothetical protein